MAAPRPVASPPARDRSVPVVYRVRNYEASSAGRCRRHGRAGGSFGPMRLPRRLAALRERNYRLFFTGQALSTLGDSMTPVAISFAILDRGGTAAQIGWVLGAGTAAMVLLLLFGGAVADRWPRRRVMLVADVVRCAVQAAVAALLVAGHWHLWELVVLEALWGAGAAFFTPAMTGLLPQLLTGEALAQGNALQALSWSVGSVAGRALSGVLVATTGPGPAVAVGTRGPSWSVPSCWPAGPAPFRRPHYGHGPAGGPQARLGGVPVADVAVGHRRRVQPLEPSGLRAGGRARRRCGQDAPRRGRGVGGHFVSLWPGCARGRPGRSAFPSPTAPGGGHCGHGRFHTAARPARRRRPGDAHGRGGCPGRRRLRPVRDDMGHNFAATGPERGALSRERLRLVRVGCLLPVGYALAGPMAAFV